MRGSELCVRSILMSKELKRPTRENEEKSVTKVYDCNQRCDSEGEKFVVIRGKASSITKRRT